MPLPPRSRVMSLSLAYLTPDSTSELALFENRTVIDRGEPDIARQNLQLAHRGDHQGLTRRSTGQDALLFTSC